MKKIFTKNKLISFLLISLFLFLLNLNLKEINSKKESKTKNSEESIDCNPLTDKFNEIDSIIQNVSLKNIEKDKEISKLNKSKNHPQIKEIYIEEKKEYLESYVIPTVLEYEKIDTLTSFVIINDTIVNEFFIYDTIQKIQIDTIVYKKEDIKKIKFRKN
jgi:hypothetical protein